MQRNTWVGLTKKLQPLNLTTNTVIVGIYLHVPFDIYTHNASNLNGFESKISEFSAIPFFASKFISAYKHLHPREVALCVTNLLGSHVHLYCPVLKPRGEY